MDSAADCHRKLARWLTSWLTRAAGCGLQGTQATIHVEGDILLDGPALIIPPGKSLELIGVCSDRPDGQCVLDASLTGHSHIVLGGSSALTLVGLKFVGGYCGDATCTMKDSGGAIWAGGESVLTLINCTFEGNGAVAQGGALFSLGSVTAINCTFSGNRAGVSAGGLSTAPSPSQMAKNRVQEGERARCIRFRSGYSARCRRAARHACFLGGAG